MLTKGRLNYVIIVQGDQLGKVSDFDDRAYQKVEIYRSEAYHYIHKKHKNLLPKLTQALQLAIKKLGPLVEVDTAAKE